MKKIDDEILNQMIAEGKSQREMAQFFGVSDAAISKRIKRLSHPEPESFKNLSPGEKRFVVARSAGLSQSAAALQAFNCGSVESAKAIGSRLSGDPDIQKAVDDLMHEEGIGRRYRIRKLRNIIDARDLSVSVKGLDMANRLTGEYSPEKIEIFSRGQEFNDMIFWVKEYLGEEKRREAEARLIAFSRRIEKPESIEAKHEDGNLSDPDDSDF